MHCGRVRRHRWSCSMRRPTVCHPSSPAHPWSEGLARKRPQPCVKGLGSDGQSSHVHHARDCKHGVAAKSCPPLRLPCCRGPARDHILRLHARTFAITHLKTRRIVRPGAAILRTATVAPASSQLSLSEGFPRLSKGFPGNRFFPKVAPFNED